MKPHEASTGRGRVADVGVQSERTYLAWQRTALAFAGVAALLVHGVGGLGHPVAALPGLLGLAVAAVILVWGFRRYRRMVAAAFGERSAAAPGTVAALTAATAVLGVAGLVLMLVQP